jgi:hypothetical protein
MEEGEGSKTKRERESRESREGAAPLLLIFLSAASLLHMLYGRAYAVALASLLAGASVVHWAWKPDLV